MVVADELERALEQQYGPLHPYVVNMLSLRAAFTLRAVLAVDHGGDWYDTAELLTRTAVRRDEAGAQPERETRNTARNAHAAWRRLAKEDPEGAMELCEDVVKMLSRFGEEKRTQEILHWVEKTRMGSNG
ncbi:hypothetical protein [Streptomyces microflavus]|uniref:hypothetical protein n=1 Tax=Streptomyces microflavus TaxID=1919 RepID=UPI003806D4FC